jgi:hypothetical protein
MDEIEWFGGSDPTRILEFLRGSASDRKLRLFACACCGRIGHLFADDHDREALAVIEQFADGRGTQSELVVVRTRAPRAIFEAAGDDAAVTAASTSAICASLLAEQHGDLNHPKGQGDYYAAEAGERKAQCRLLRELFGNPFRPGTFSPEWRTDTALSLARQMYESREFSTMPILADALQDAGCDSDDVLNHCRGTNATHVRGCWVCDLVLGKE